MATTNRFQLRQAKQGIAGRCPPLEFAQYVEARAREEGGDELFPRDPVISSVFGDSVDYGALTAYLFRRFGYPLRGWDGYKQLIRYLLTTPLPSMFLEVVPSISGDPELTFRFYVQDGVFKQVEAYNLRASRAWLERAYDFQEAKGLPQWMPDWVQLVNETLLPGWGAEGTCNATWRESMRYATPLGTPGDGFYALSKQAADFRELVRAEFAAREPEPTEVFRSPDWLTWPEDDPLKPLAIAAHVALSNLLRPVRVRDGAINALGLVDATGRTLEEAPGAGYPSGALGNEAAEEFSEVHALVHTLGKGNVKKGLERLMSFVPAELRASG